MVAIRLGGTDRESDAFGAAQLNSKRGQVKTYARPEKAGVTIKPEITDLESYYHIENDACALLFASVTDNALLYYKLKQESSRRRNRLDNLPYPDCISLLILHSLPLLVDSLLTESVTCAIRAFKQHLIMWMIEQ